MKENTYYDFWISEQTIYNLKIGNNYYLHKIADKKGTSEFYIILIMDNIDKNPFKGWIFDNDNKNESKISYPDIKKYKDNKSFLFISSSYKLNNKSWTPIRKKHTTIIKYNHYYI